VEAIEGGSLTTGQMAQVAGISEAEVQQHLEQLKKDKIFLGWRPVLDLSHETAAANAVRAVIEVKITPERGGGFNRLADRLARFDEVESCYLMSGGYDLLVFVKGSSLQKVAGSFPRSYRPSRACSRPPLTSCCVATKSRVFCWTAAKRKVRASRSRLNWRFLYP